MSIAIVQMVKQVKKSKSLWWYLNESKALCQCLFAWCYLIYTIGWRQAAKHLRQCNLRRRRRWDYFYPFFRSYIRNHTPLETINEWTLSPDVLVCILICWSTDQYKTQMRSIHLLRWGQWGREQGPCLVWRRGQLGCYSNPRIRSSVLVSVRPSQKDANG